MSLVRPVELFELRDSPLVFQRAQTTITLFQLRSSPRAGALKAASWEEALATVAAKLNQHRGADIAAVVGPLADAEVRY